MLLYPRYLSISAACDTKSLDLNNFKIKPNFKKFNQVIWNNLIEVSIPEVYYLFFTPIMNKVICVLNQLSTTVLINYK